MSWMNELDGTPGSVKADAFLFLLPVTVDEDEDKYIKSVTLTDLTNVGTVTVVIVDEDGKIDLLQLCRVEGKSLAKWLNRPKSQEFLKLFPFVTIPPIK